MNIPPMLVSCLGAYEDSGLGTGGLVCIRDGRVVVLDKLDGTGLCERDGVVYRWVRALHALVGYTVDGLVSLLRLQAVRDVHDILVLDDSIVAVSTGHNEVCWLDRQGRCVRKWSAKGERDAWHLNCLCVHDGQLHVSAFGEFDSHREWHGRSTGAGFIMNLDTGERPVRNVSGPHSPRFLDGGWLVCESHIGKVTRQSMKDGQISRREVDLNGFTRGVAWDDRSLYVGVSTNRETADAKSTSAVAVLDRKSFEVRERITVPFPEIYEILIISDELAARMEEGRESFVFDISDVRMLALENQVERAETERQALLRRLRRRNLVFMLYQRAKARIFGLHEEEGS